MKKFYTLLIIFLSFSFTAKVFAEKNIKLDRIPAEQKGVVSQEKQVSNITAIPIPVLNVPLKTIRPVIFKDNLKKPEILNGNTYNTVSTDSVNQVLLSKDYTAFVLDTKSETVSKTVPESKLSQTSIDALGEAPNWLYDQLKLKLDALSQNNLDAPYAQLILDASENIKDEVAFCVANMSCQTLTDPLFALDKQMIIRNAEFIYNVVDSLQYVKLVEHGSYANRDYYTTTEYRIYDSQKNDTIWSEIPKEYYYWYIVHPKLDQENVYVKDNGNDNSGQRTYGYSWRDFIWNDPDPAHDYRNVNITTSKGTVSTIPRFGDLIKTPKILWDRQKTYFSFGRDFKPENSALDVVGNWCSRAVPVDVQLPRAFQPNQILMKHNGMCNEDAFLTAAACRTALIPIIYLGEFAEDHVFGSVWDDDWNHFEFFRGGLQVPGNQYYGITNMLDRGSYGWTTSMVEGFRGDGYESDFTTYYADTCHFNLTVTDSLGNPIDGAMVQIYAPYGSGYEICQRLFTNREGKLGFAAGISKQYLVNVYHPTYGWNPVVNTQAFYLLQGTGAKDASYNVTIPYMSLKLQNDSPETQELPNSGNYGFQLNLNSNEIITGVNVRDGQQSRFYKWNDESSGIVTFFVCDSANYDNFINNRLFNSYHYTPYLNGGNIICVLPGAGRWYVVLENRSVANIYEKVNAACCLLKGLIQVNVKDNNRVIEYGIYPNPFNEFCRIEFPQSVTKAVVYDIFGRQVDQINNPFIWRPNPNLPDGTYFIRAIDGNTAVSYKGILRR